MGQTLCGLCVRLLSLGSPSRRHQTSDFLSRVAEAPVLSQTGRAGLAPLPLTQHGTRVCGASAEDERLARGRRRVNICGVMVPRSSTAMSDPQASHILPRGVKDDTAAREQCASRCVLKPCVWEPRCQSPVGRRRPLPLGQGRMEHTVKCARGPFDDLRKGFKDHLPPKAHTPGSSHSTWGFIWRRLHSSSERRGQTPRPSQGTAAC